MTGMDYYGQEPDLIHQTSAYPSSQTSERDSYYSGPHGNHQERLNAYEDVSDSQWNRNLNELSIREEPYSNYLSVPPPRNGTSAQQVAPSHPVVPNGPLTLNNAQSNRPSYSSNHRVPSYYPLRRNSAQPSENSQWASNNRTETIPTVMRRPY